MILPRIPYWVQKMALRVDWKDSVPPKEYTLSWFLTSLSSKIECERHYCGRLVHKLPNTTAWCFQLPRNSSPFAPTPAFLGLQQGWVGYHAHRGAKCGPCAVSADPTHTADPGLWAKGEGWTKKHLSWIKGVATPQGQEGGRKRSAWIYLSQDQQNSW